jgi:L-fucose mutarotase
MLKNIDPLLTGELLDAMQTMGHGDDIVICDRNHPAATIAAQTTWGSLILVAGSTLPQLSKAMLSLFPLDTFVDAPITRMQVVGKPKGTLVQAHHDMQAAADAAEGRKVKIGSLERFAFYEAAKRSFAIVQTSDPGPYGCFILKKGVL